MSSGGLYLHIEESLSETHTIKLDLRTDVAVTVAQAIETIAQSYTRARGRTFVADGSELRTIDGKVLCASWVLPCGLPIGSDLLVVRSGGSSTPIPAAADAIRASQAHKGENSYYYSVNKNLGNTIAPIEPHVPKAVHTLGSAVRQSTIATYSMIDGEQRVRVNIPLAGAQRLPANGVCVGFFDRSFKLAVRPDCGTELCLNIPLLLELVDQARCAVKVLEGRLVLLLAKREPDKVWYELRKTKGVGDTEYDKLVPWTGELVTVLTGGAGEPLPDESAPGCFRGPPVKS